MSRQLPPEDTTPWYRQFWPWFLIMLPASMVVAALSTVFVAFSGADDLVDDQYYQDGLAINQELDKREQAEALGITASLEVTGDEVRVHTQGPAGTERLRLLLSHPMEADRDFQVMLIESTPGDYRGRLAAGVAPRWHWTLEPATDPTWHLVGSLSQADFTAQGSG